MPILGEWNKKTDLSGRFCACRSLSCLGSYSSCFGLVADAASAGFNSVASVISSPVQVRLEPYNASAHGVASFYGAAVGFPANGTHSRHSIEFKTEKSKVKISSQN